MKSDWSKDTRLAGLRRFAAAITVFNVVGHTVLGFEQSLIQPLASLAVAYSLELLFEFIGARIEGRSPRFVGGPLAVFDFLLSAHITGLAVAMLLYANDRVMPVMFASACAMGSKAIFRIPVGATSRHVFNPSNLGISVTLILFPWVSIAPPYHFTEYVVGIWDWVLPGIIIVSGSVLNARYTGRFPLLTAWLGGFALQALLRSLFLGTPIAAGFMPMTGLAFVLYTFYMVTDPGTTPSSTRGQVVFGLSVATVYAILMLCHIVFGLFFALTAVCVVRWVGIHVKSAWRPGRLAPALWRRLHERIS